MESFVPDPDIIPIQPYRRQPLPCGACGVTVFKSKFPERPRCKACYLQERREAAARERKTHLCETCGKPRTKYSKLCNSCYKAVRRGPEICTAYGCKNKTRRKSLCNFHYERKFRYNTKEFRDKNHRIRVKAKEGGA